MASRWLASWRRNRLFRKYVVPFVGVVLLALLSNGLLEIYFAYQENKSALAQAQREKATAAALRIEGFVKEIERQMGWTTQPHLAAGGGEQRRLDYVRLMRQVAAITEVAYLDVQGREQLRIHRLAMDVIGSGIDLSSTPRFTATRGGQTWYGPVYFRKESEPYMALAIPHGKGGAVSAAEVNLKFIWDVVSQIRIGKSGHAYVVDAGGHLIAHPDISLVLKKTDLSALPQIRAARAAPTPLAEGWDEGMIATSLDGRRSLVAHTAIAPLGWIVVVEQPLIEAFAALRGSILRTGLLMLLGVVVSVAASLVLARKMARPIQALHTGAARIGAGDLAHQIDIKTRDELEDLAGEFNRMTARLRESHATLEQRVEERTRELSETLDQQTATAEILKVISSSPTDVQPVLDAVAESATRVCGASDALIFRVDGGNMHRVAHFGSVPAVTAIVRPIAGSSAVGRSILECRTIHLHDVLDADAAREYPESAATHSGAGVRAVLSVPLIRDGAAVGAIAIRRPEAQPFSDKQVALLQTFADQAVIAIENVRLFNELEARNAALMESLGQQTATSEILRVISSSPTDIEPVMRAVVESAARLCEAQNAQIFRVEDETMRLVARHGPVRSSLEVGEARAITRRSVSGRTIVDRTTVHILDLIVEADQEYSDIAPAIHREAIRTTVGVPLLREGTPIGSITAFRTDVRPFSDKQIALLQTFADQAVIAIENVRLFTELQEKNRAIGEALEQQTATSEILRVISRSPTDIQPVFDTIVQSAVRLCNAASAAVFRVQGGVLYEPANYGSAPEALATTRARYPRPLGMDTTPGIAILTRSVGQVPDIEDPSAIEFVRQTGRLLGVRSVITVPMLREGEAVGAIVVTRREPGRFSDAEVELLKTFTDQAVIAIENVRLFNETEEKTRQLEAANRHKDEFLASMSHELRTPLNAVIGFSEVLLERMFGEINAKQDEYLNDILASGRHLLSLINDILDLAKIEAGRMELDLEEFEMAQAIDNAVVLVRERATRKGLALETALAPALGTVRGDQRKIKQVLLNLLSNAVKFTPEGGRVEVRAQRVDGHVEVSVTDTGIGIAVDDQEAVFEEFRQVGTDYAKKHEGTGLGLTLSRKFVELHGGRIAVKSRLGEGSTFTFTLPVHA